MEGAKKKLSNFRSAHSDVNFQFSPCRNCGLYREVIMQDGNILTFPDRSLISPDKFTCSNLPPEGWEEAYAKSENFCGGELNHREIEYNKDKPLHDTTKSESVGVDGSLEPPEPTEESPDRARAGLLGVAEKNLTSENKYDNKEQIMDILQNAEEGVFSFITSGHGRLLNPSDGVNYDILPNNMKLLIMVSRGANALSDFGAAHLEWNSVKLLKAFKNSHEEIKKSIS